MPTNNSKVSQFSPGEIADTVGEALSASGLADHFAGGGKDIGIHLASGMTGAAVKDILRAQQMSLDVIGASFTEGFESLGVSSDLLGSVSPAAMYAAAQRVGMKTGGFTAWDYNEDGEITGEVEDSSPFTDKDIDQARDVLRDAGLLGSRLIQIQ